MQIAGQLKGILYHFPLLTCGLANGAPELMRRVIDALAA